MDHKPSDLRVYGGQCHCGAVRFRVHADKHLVAWDCNCSICFMKKNWHFVVPQNQFKLLPAAPEKERVHAGSFLDYVENADARFPLHWGHPPAEGELAAWIQWNTEADQPNFPSVPEEHHGYITAYQFETRVARHTFCRICGVQAFYHPRSNPDGVAVTLDCLLPGVRRMSHLHGAYAGAASAPAEDEFTGQCTCEVRTFDGQNWENYIEKSGIRAFSQTNA